MADDLHALKDDMNAFIVGHGLQRFHALVSEDMNSVLWDSANNLDSWKDFVELAKGCGIAFLTFSEDTLERDDLDFLLERLEGSEVNSEEMDEARWLKAHVNKMGFIQLGFSYQGTMFLWETSTPWYERYQQLLETCEGISSILLDDLDRRDRDKRDRDDDPF